MRNRSLIIRVSTIRIIFLRSKNTRKYGKSIKTKKKKLLKVLKVYLIVNFNVYEIS